MLVFGVIHFFLSPFISSAFCSAASPSRDEPEIFSICTENFKAIKHKDKVTALFTQNSARPPCKEITSSSTAAKVVPIKIKRRGQSSDTFAKKQYQIDFIDKNGEDIDVALLGLPKAAEWVLHGPYVDRSYIRNALAYRIGSKVGMTNHDEFFAPKTRFVEVIINDDYKGLYVLVQKIQRGKGYVDIPKINFKNPQDIHYILEFSKLRKNYDFKTSKGTSFEYVYPSSRKLKEVANKDPAIAQEIRKKISDEMSAFEANFATITPDSQNICSLIDCQSFIDFFILQELTKKY